MPTYEYQCKKCGHKFEAFQQITEKLLEKCPKCQGPLKRLIGPGAGFIFKGSGFYATDYRKKEKPKPQVCESNTCKECPADKNKNAS